MWIVYLAVGVACVLALVAVCVFAARLLWRSGTVGKAVVVLALLAIGPTLYRVVVPPASSYLDEFTRLSGLPLPESAEVVDRSATFPDLKGHYRACVVVRLTPPDARALERRLVVPVGSAPLRPCGMVGRVNAAGEAMQYRVTYRGQRDQAVMTVAVDSRAGYLKAEWHIHRRVKGE